MKAPLIEAMHIRLIAPVFIEQILQLVAVEKDRAGEEIVSYGFVICMRDWFFVDFRGKFRVFKPEPVTVEFNQVKVFAANVRD